MALIKIKKPVIRYICVILLILVCYVLLDGRSDKDTKGDLEKHSKVRDGPEHMHGLRVEEEINIFIILCIRLDGNGDFVSI